MTDQPRYPDVFGYDEQDPAGDQDETYIAPDEPMGAHSFGNTVAEERAGETFAERDDHTSAEVWERSERDVGDGVHALVQPGDEDVDLTDDEAALVALERRQAADLAAEEQAMHRTEAP